MKRLCAAAFTLVFMPALNAAAAELPDSIAAPNEIVVLQAHAEGAQIYECKADPTGQLLWQFSEPIATLMVAGKTVGRHYAGPTWEIGGSAVTGKLAGRSPGAASTDIPWLKLDVADHQGDGPLRDVTTVQRIETHGGTATGTCDMAGRYRSEPYSADYVFLRR